MRKQSTAMRIEGRPSSTSLGGFRCGVILARDILQEYAGVHQWREAPVFQCSCPELNNPGKPTGHNRFAGEHFWPGTRVAGCLPWTVSGPDKDIHSLEL
jgi:hypothetical protein